MIGNVTSVSKSKSGKAWRVLIEDQTGAQTYYGANFASKIDKAQGSKISFTSENGQFGAWIQDWDFARETAVAPPVVTAPIPAPAGTPVAQPQAKANGHDRWWLPFSSNQCAHAIAAGLIKNPADLKAWAIAAREAADAADDSLPF